jgi:hypothetical protein
MLEIKYRLAVPGLRPRRTKLEMPGWAGKPVPRADGSHEYAWHCAPFTEGAQYGIEIFYPYDNELHVGKKGGDFVFDGDFGPPPDDDLQWPPFRTFGKDYYTYQLLLDLKVGKEWAVRSSAKRPGRSRLAAAGRSFEVEEIGRLAVRLVVMVVVMPLVMVMMMVTIGSAQPELHEGR